MALLFFSGPLSGSPDPEYTQEFISNSQPLFIYVSGDFSSPQLWKTAGSVVVEYQMQDGSWIESTDMRFNKTDSGTFRFAPSMKGRVKVTGCKSVNIELHSSEVA